MPCCILQKVLPHNQKQIFLDVLKNDNQNALIIGNEILLWCEKLVSTPFRCIQRNLGRETVVSIKDSNDWGCFVCHPQQIYEHKARYYSLFRLNKIPGFQTMPYKPNNMIPGKRKSDALFRKAEHIIHSSQHFIDENIGMVAFNKSMARKYILVNFCIEQVFTYIIIIEL